MQTSDQDPGRRKTTAERWQDRVEDAVDRAEDELRTLITYINDEVVPDVRRSGSDALRIAANKLGKLAERMDDHRAGHSTGHSTGTNPKP